MSGSDRVARLGDRLATLAAITAPGPGVTRPAFSPLERTAHEQLASWGALDGARAEVDAAGNTVLVYGEGEPYVLLGSHLDSVPSGGRYDGAAGVVAALDVAREAAPGLGLGLRVVAFSAEEGARFGRPCLGSELATGAMPDGLLASLQDADGASALDAARTCGLDPHAIEPWATEPAVAAFVEIHIEQGRTLEREGVRIGVVDVVAGATRLNVAMTGREEHSGPTPREARRDALAAMSELVLAVERVGQDARHGVATIGRLDVTPNSATTVPGGVRAVVDIRDIDAGRQAEAVAAVRRAIDEIARRRDVGATVTVVADRPPVMLSVWARQALAEACGELGQAFRVMPSGAGHDAAVLALRTAAAIVFVPTPHGRSHSPDERLDIDDLALACAVTAVAVRRLDRTARGLEATEA